MSDNYITEYTQFINDLQTELMNIQFRFDACINLILIDIKQGLLSVEEGQKLLLQRMDTYYSDVDSKYRLSKEDTDFVKEYADVDEKGQILITLLKREYISKIEKIHNMFKSISIFAYLNSLDENEAIAVIKDKMSNYYSSELNDVKLDIDKLLKTYKEKEKKSIRYLKLQNKKDELEKKLSIIEQLENISHDIVIKIIENFYNIEVKYYNWYLKMDYYQNMVNNQLNEKQDSPKVKENATPVHKKIRKEELYIQGITFEELEKIYIATKAYIENDFKFGNDAGELILKKI